MLPELLKVKEFVNADEIARGLSPFQPEKVSIEAGKIMLRRLKELLYQSEDFAFETTLSSRSFVELIKAAKTQSYSVNLIYYWLDSTELAIERVKTRVSEGGHNIPENVIIRRYYSGLRNFFSLYKNIVDYWMVIDNSITEPELIAEGWQSDKQNVHNLEKWKIINKLVDNHETDRNKK